MKILLNKVMFVLPARAFFIDYTVSEKRQLPVVKEFVVRLLYSTDGADPNILKKYFGFSDVEMNSILDDLLEESLVEWDDERVVLSQYASGKFEELGGRMIPRFFEVVDKYDDVRFELHDFKMLPRDIVIGGGNNRIGINLTLPNESFKNLDNKAQGAFDSNFQRFREVIKKEDIYAERQELYKINHVVSKYDCVVPLEVEYYIDSNAPTELKTGYVSPIFDEWDEEKNLFTTMDECIPCVKEAIKGHGLPSYLVATKDPFLLKYWNDEHKVFDYEVMLNHFVSGVNNEGEETQMILGNLYTDTNSVAILDKLNSIFDGKKSTSGLIWFANTDTATWGRSDSFSKLLSRIRELFDGRRVTTTPVAVVSCDSGPEAYELRQIFGGLDAKFLGCAKRFGGSATEVLLIPDVMVACLYHSDIDDHRNIQLPVGYISFNKSQIHVVEEQVRKWAVSREIFNSYFEPKDVKDKETTLQKIFLPSIDVKI